MYEYRVYDADLGRWMSRDPLGEEGGWNLFGYCNNSATRTIDPFGLEIKFEAMKGADAVLKYMDWKNDLGEMPDPNLLRQYAGRDAVKVWYEGGCDCEYADGTKEGTVVLVQYVNTGRWFFENWVPDPGSPGDPSPKPWKETCPSGIIITHAPAYLDPDTATGRHGGLPGSTPGSYIDSATYEQTFKIEAWCRCNCKDDRLLETETILLHYKHNGKNTSSKPNK